MRLERSLSIGFLIAMLLSACAPAKSPVSTLPRVIAAETFLHDIAQNVAGSRLAVDSLLQPMVDPHEYQPKPRDVTRLAQSQVLIVNGLGYESWLQKTLDTLSGSRLVIVATKGLVPLTEASGGGATADPHMWMDPLNVIGYVTQIRDGLTQADPQGKDIYSANAQAYIAQLKDLDAWVKTEVALLPPDQRLLVTNHDALGYFANAYGFSLVGAVIPSVTADAAPSARQMVDLIHAINASRARAIFLDLGESQKLAQQISGETKVKVVADLYVESLSDSSGPAPTYLEMIKHDVTVIVDGLQGTAFITKPVTNNFPASGEKPI
jgi:zinc/manganese transport system substrate-binding protein